MLLRRTFALWLLLAFLGQQISLSSGAGNKNRGADETVIQASGRVRRSGDKPAASGWGKFSTEDNMRCTWGARDVGDTVRVSVKCENGEARIKDGVTDLKCEYNAKPQSCPGYQSDPEGFWKQVARAFKRLQDKVCKDDLALVKAGMCKSAPRDAHFKLDIASSVAAAPSGKPETPMLLPPRSDSTAAAPAGPTACTRGADHQELAEVLCGSSWASVCSFFLSLLQSDDC